MTDKILCINLTCYPPASPAARPEYYVWAFIRRDPETPDTRGGEADTELRTHDRNEALDAFETLEKRMEQ